MSLLRKLLIDNMPKDYIKFADPVVEKICAENYGDKVGTTYINALNVVQINDWGPFYNKALTSFDELEYFSNISYIGHGGFRNSKVSIQDVKLPNLTKLGGHTFEGTNIKRVSDLGSLSAITTWDYAYTFNGCSQLEYVKLPDTLKQIASRMFIECPKLLTIDLGKNVEKIAEWFCYNCKSLNNVILKTLTPPSFISSTFFLSGSTSSTVNIYVPDESVDLYKAADVWSTRADYVKPLSEYKETN